MVLGNIFNQFIAFVGKRNADAGRQNVRLWWTLPFICALHQCHISFLYLTFKLTVYVFFLQYDFVRILGLLKPEIKAVRRKVMDSLKCFKVFEVCVDITYIIRDVNTIPPLFRGGGNGSKNYPPRYWALVSATLFWKGTRRIIILKCFWYNGKVYTLLGVHSKLQARGKYIKQKFIQPYYNKADSNKN